MRRSSMPSIKLLSSDLNGTLVQPHTMQEMIRVGFPEEPVRYEKARAAFALQTEGRLSLAETFRIAGEQTRGLPLRIAIEYAMRQMPFMAGYRSLMSFVENHGIHLAIVSTGYTVTLHAIRYSTLAIPFHARCNRLVFAHSGGTVLGEEELESLVRQYIQRPGASSRGLYDSVRATGEVVLGIQDEGDKARLALDLARSLGVPFAHVAHMGDTMGDSEGILGVARAGGLGIAFNYNQALAAFLLREGAAEIESGHILLVEPKGPDSDLEKVIPLLE
jgi:phosphoserine phosphatase